MSGLDRPRLGKVPTRLLSPRAAAGRPTPVRQHRALALCFGSALITLLLLLLGATLYTNRYAGRVYRGVGVAGVDLGGLRRDAAVARLDERAAAYATAPVRVRPASGGGGQQAWTIAPAELGVAFDTGAAADRALAYGRGGGALDNFAARFGGLLPGGGTDLTLPAALDEARLDAALRAWAPAATYWPTDAVFTVGQGGQLAIVPDKDGLGLDAGGSRQAFLTHAAGLSRQPLTLPQAPVPAAITARMLQDIEGRASAVTAQPLTLRIGERTWALPPEQLRAALRYRKDGERLVAALDPAPLAPFFGQVSAGAARPGVNAKLVYEGGRYVVQPGQEGNVLDEAATLAAIDAALTEGRSEASGALKPQNPPIVAADLEPIRARAEKIVSTPLVVGFGEEPERFAHTFGRADLQPLLVFTEQPAGPEKLAIGVDEQGLRALTQFLAGELNQGVRDAQFTFARQAVRDVVASRQGREVQFAGTDQALRAAILGATGRATPEVAVTEPTIKSSDKARMNIVERLAYGETDYSSSSADRKHNVEWAAEKLDGALIPPDAVFSFNEATGEQTIEAGLKPGYGIALASDGRATTVSSVGGGICQVSTTLYHGVFRAGLPIEDRSWHLFWLAYGEQGVGVKGLDATVDEPTGLDFKFRNTTSGWLALEAGANGETLRVSVWGKDPGWDVSIDDPVISNVQRADPKVVYQRTHDLPPGAQRPIEDAQDGFTASIRIRVRDGDGKLIRDKTFTSNYLPSRNVVQVGVPQGQPTGDTEERPLTGN